MSVSDEAAISVPLDACVVLSAPLPLIRGLQFGSVSDVDAGAMRSLPRCIGAGSEVRQLCGGVDSAGDGVRAGLHGGYGRRGLRHRGSPQHSPQLDWLTSSTVAYGEPMLHAFIDESYVAGQVHLIGALVLDARQIDALTLALDEVIWKTNRAHPEVPLSIELHGQNLFQRTEEWSCLRENGKTSLAFAVYRRALHHIQQVGGVWFVGGVRRIDRLEHRYGDRAWPPHQIALQYTLEMVNSYAAERGERVQVVADEVPDQAHHEARMRQFQGDGRTPGWRPSDLGQIDMPFSWEESRQHRPLQAVDLLTYLYKRKRFDVDAHGRTRHEVAKMRDIVRPMLVAQHIWTP